MLPSPKRRPGVLLITLQCAGRPLHRVPPAQSAEGQHPVSKSSGDCRPTTPGGARGSLPAGVGGNYASGPTAARTRAPRRSSPTPPLSLPRSSFQPRVLRPGQRGARPQGHTETQIRVPHSLFLGFGDVLQPLIYLLSCHLQGPAADVEGKSPGW